MFLDKTKQSNNLYCIFSGAAGGKGFCNFMRENGADAFMRKLTDVDADEYTILMKQPGLVYDCGGKLLRNRDDIYLLYAHYPADYMQKIYDALIGT